MEIRSNTHSFNRDKYEGWEIALKVGIGIRDITPKLGMRSEIFQNVEVDIIVTLLLIKVCIFVNGKEKGAIVSADVMDFFADSIRDIRNINWCYSAAGNGETLLEAAKTLIKKVYKI